jgi:histone-lysine N-methyltransferase SETMAR
LHENASSNHALAIPNDLAYLGFQCLNHPYSPNLAPLDYHLFPGLKKLLKEHNVSSDTEVIAAAEAWLDEKFSEFF